MIYIAVGLTLSLTLVVYANNDLRAILGLAWDCGAVTTGPVTVPLVLSLGIGIANSAGQNSDNSLSGFGVVTLASLFPIIAVLLLSLYVSTQISAEQIVVAAHGGQRGGRRAAEHLGAIAAARSGARRARHCAFGLVLDVCAVHCAS